ncbi:hypothetical protein FHS09_000692 [Microbulbifer rhizosphaerae]|uniref:Uncharacterized protein n=1 Tax=Microbulbifer rhizosphaerae TaxID=1562603 RepID=A0A7W4W943_9GAMM|nr:hypothetical protein [Microbulbifer rhizosphaerae]
MTSNCSALFPDLEFADQLPLPGLWMVASVLVRGGICIFLLGAKDRATIRAAEVPWNVDKASYNRRHGRR